MKKQQPITIQPRSKSQKRIKHLQKIGFKHEVIKLRKDYNNTNKLQQFKHHEKSKSMKNIVKQQIIKSSGNFLDPSKIITASAAKWVIYDYYTSKYIRGYRAHDPYQLSIFSKLLVLCTLNTLITNHKIDTTRFQTIVTSTVIKYYKNTQLKIDDIITLDHLIHMMIMDQGQQYQLIAAINIGAYLQKKRKKQYYSVYDADQKLIKIHLAQFYDLVNSYCQTMKMQNVKYVQADPIKKKQLNKCSAADIAVLSAQCLKIPKIRQILHLKTKIVQIKYINNDGILQTRNIQLKNKTVINPYISYFNVCRNWQENQFMNSSGSVFYQQTGIQPIIVVLLGCYGPNDRQKDIQQIIEWYLKGWKLDQARKQKLKNNNNKEINIEPVTIRNNDQTDIMKQQQKQQNIIKTKQDPQTIIGIRKKSTNRFKTQQSKQLQTILEQKLKGYNNNSQFRIKQRKNTKKLITQI